MDNLEQERKGRTSIQSLGLDGSLHEALAIHKHLAHATAMKPDIVGRHRTHNIKKDL